MLNVRQAGSLPWEANFRGLLTHLVDDFQAHACLARDSDAAVLNSLFPKETAVDFVVVNAQETGDDRGMTKIGEKGGHVDGLAPRMESGELYTVQLPALKVGDGDSLVNRRID